MIAGLAFRNVLRNKERSLLTLVGVVLAIGSFVALVSLAAGFTQRVERELGSREVHIYITAGRGSTLPASPLAGAGGGGPVLPLELEELFGAVAGVRSVTPILRTSLDGSRAVLPVIAMPLSDAKIVFKGAQFSSDPGGLNANFPMDGAPQSSSTPLAGPVGLVTPTPTAEPVSSPAAKVAVSPSPAVSASPLATPASQPTPAVSADPAEPPSKLVPVALLVVGQGLGREVKEALAGGGPLVIEEMPFQVGADVVGDGFLDYTILAPIEPFLRQRDNRGVHEYWITLDSEGKVEQIQAEVQKVVDGFLAREKDRGDYAGARKIRVLSRTEYLSSARDYLGYGWLLQVAVSMVGVLIAITASMNTMLMSTYERLGEYATLRAVGASRRVIALTIIYEAIFLNVTGGFLGLVFGFLATGVLDKAVAILLEIPYPMAGVTPGLLLQALGLSFLVGLVGAIIPIFIVSRIDLVAQLRKGM